MDPCHPMLDWSKASHYNFLEDFRLLYDTHHDIHSKPLGRPSHPNDNEADNVHQVCEGGNQRLQHRNTTPFSPTYLMRTPNICANLQGCSKREVQLKCSWGICNLQALSKCIQSLSHFQHLWLGWVIVESKSPEVRVGKPSAPPSPIDHSQVWRIALMMRMNLMNRMQLIGMNLYNTWLNCLWFRVVHKSLWSIVHCYLIIRIAFIQGEEEGRFLR